MNKELIDKMIEEYEERIQILEGCIMVLRGEKNKLKLEEWDRENGRKN